MVCGWNIEYDITVKVITVNCITVLTFVILIIIYTAVDIGVCSTISLIIQSIELYCSIVFRVGRIITKWLRLLTVFITIGRFKSIGI